MVFQDTKNSGRKPYMEDQVFLLGIRPKRMVSSDLFVLTVADGVGACVHSDKVAFEALALFVDEINRFLLKNEEKLVAITATIDSTKELLWTWLTQDALKNVNARLLQTFPGEDIGTTITAAIAFAGEVFVCGVGDSPAYLLHGDEMEQLLELDHLKGRRNVLTESLGDLHGVRPHFARRPFTLDDRLVLGSDGAFGALPEAEIQRILSQRDARSSTGWSRTLLETLCREAAETTDDNQAAALLLCDNRWYI
ncbi:MAG: protein phosphatase 2C domain-containing protein [Oscillospiraceae bacterium]|nr:protein phosphatase 2C domain-containing protein [Oscillospiraceae bacterium]